MKKRLLNIGTVIDYKLFHDLDRSPFSKFCLLKIVSKRQMNIQTECAGVECIVNLVIWGLAKAMLLIKDLGVEEKNTSFKYDSKLKSDSISYNFIYFPICL